MSHGPYLCSLKTNALLSTRQSRSANEEGHTDVELVWHTLALHQPELAEVIAVIAGEEHIGVGQQLTSAKRAEHPLNGVVDALQRLQPTSLEKVGEDDVHRLHFAGVAQKPLLVRVGRIVPRRCPMRIDGGDAGDERTFVESAAAAAEGGGVVRCRILGTVGRRKAQHHEKRRARRLVGCVAAAALDEAQRLVGDQIGEVVLRQLCLAPENIKAIR